MGQSKSQTSVAPVVVRSSFRLVRPLYSLSFLLLAIVYGINNNRPDPMEWLLIFPALLFMFTVWRHIQQRFQVMTVGGGKLRYETGMLSRSTRTMELSRIQDIRVNQSFLQRMIGIGNIEFETAGESGRLLVRNIDRPQSVADYILESAKK